MADSYVPFSSYRKVSKCISWVIHEKMMIQIHQLIKTRCLSWKQLWCGYLRYNVYVDYVGRHFFISKMLNYVLF